MLTNRLANQEVMFLSPLSTAKDCPAHLSDINQHPGQGSSAVKAAGSQMMMNFRQRRLVPLDTQDLTTSNWLEVLLRLRVVKQTIDYYYGSLVTSCGINLHKEARGKHLATI